jgi:hypothetical protein
MLEEIVIMADMKKEECQSTFCFSLICRHHSGQMEGQTGSDFNFRVSYKGVSLIDTWTNSYL